MSPTPPDLNIIDRFMAAFGQYIDSGFGLLGPDVAFLTTTLIGIDITLAGLWWAMDGERDVLSRFLKKILYVGVFALILSNFQHLADIIFRSFAGLGLTAGGGAMTADDLLKPGALAGRGFSAAQPLIDKAGGMLGFPDIFGNALIVIILLVAWLLVVLAFFMLAIQIFITIIEFKLTTLAGFVLVPFALFNKTSFLAERVLGNVIASGLKVMVLAVIVGIGSGFFAQFTAAIGGDPGIAEAMTLVLGALSLLGLGIFGPGIAAGLVTGAPQLGAGAAIGTAAGVAIMGVGGAALGARAIGAAASGGMSAIKAGTAMGSAARASYQLGQATSGSTSVAAGLGGVASAAGGAARQGAGALTGRIAQPFRDSIHRGRDAAWNATGGAAQTTADPAGASGASGVAGRAAASGPPAWARQMRGEQARRYRHQMLLHTLKDGDRGGSGLNPSLKED